MILKSVAASVAATITTTTEEDTVAGPVEESAVDDVDVDGSGALVEATRKELRNRVPRRVPIVELNEHLTCYLCKGYFIEATTIIECLHSFCRSCIVTYLESNKYCPVCDVQVHKTKPLLNIRPDKTLQDITYKLVPKLFQNELQKRREYYAQHPEAKPSQLETRAEATYQHLLTPDEMLCISLLYDGAPESCTPRYLRCSASVSMAHLQKLIRNKYDLSPLHRVEILHQNDALAAYLTLMDVAYIYLWRRKVPLALTYRIYENIKKTTLSDTAENNNNRRPESDGDGIGEDGWKEVQLRISENGEMSVTGIQDCLSLLDANILQDDQKLDQERAAQDAQVQVQTPSKKLKLDKKKEAKEKVDKGNKKQEKRELRSALQVKTSNTNRDIFPTPGKEKSKDKTKVSKIGKERKRKSMEILEEKEEDREVGSKRSKLSEEDVSAAVSMKGVKEAIAQGVSQSVVSAPPMALQNLSKNHPLKKYSLNNAAKSATVTSASVTSPGGYTPKTTQASSTAPVLSPTTHPSNTTMHASNAPAPNPSVPTAPILQQPTRVKDTSAHTQNAPTPSLSSTQNAKLSTAHVPKTPPAHAPSAKQLPMHHQQYGSYTPPPPRVYTPPGLPSGGQPTNYTPLTVPNVTGMRGPIPRPYIPPGTVAHSRLRRPEDMPGGIRPGWQNHRQVAPSLGSPVVVGVGTGKIGPGLKGGPPGSSNVALASPGTPPTPGAPGDLRNVRPAKFFKMRNNMPRYLGCPASGVKPMYMQESGDEGKDGKEEEGKVMKSKSMTTKNIVKNVKTESDKNVKNLKDTDRKSPLEKKDDTSGVKNSIEEETKTPKGPVLKMTKNDEKQSTNVKTESEKEVLTNSQVSEKREDQREIVKIDPKTLKPIVDQSSGYTMPLGSLTTSSDILTTSSGVLTTSSDVPTTSSGISTTSSGVQIASSIINLTTSSGHQTTATSTPSTHQVTTSTVPSNLQQDLKINTSSVSIFNPIKLQSERRSPHSPGGKRPTVSPTVSNPGTPLVSSIQASTSLTPNGGQSASIPSPSNGNLAHSRHSPGAMAMSAPTLGMMHHHHKNKSGVPPGSLGYTSPNPFVANLSASGMPPGGFMYPSGGFPYDPMMAAFLAYSRPSFNYDFHKMQMGQMQMNQLGYGPLSPGCQPQAVPASQSQVQAQQSSREPSAASIALAGTKKKEEKPDKTGFTSSSARSKAGAAHKEIKHSSDSAISSSAASQMNAAVAVNVQNKEVKERRESPTHLKSNKTTKSEKTLQNALDKLTKAKMGDGNDTPSSSHSVFSIIREETTSQGVERNNHRHLPLKSGKIEITSDITITPSMKPKGREEKEEKAAKVEDAGILGTSQQDFPNKQKKPPAKQQNSQNQQQNLQTKNPQIKQQNPQTKQETFQTCVNPKELKSAKVSATSDEVKTKTLTSKSVVTKQDVAEDMKNDDLKKDITQTNVNKTDSTSSTKSELSNSNHSESKPPVSENCKPTDDNKQVAVDRNQVTGVNKLQTLTSEVKNVHEPNLKPTLLGLPSQSTCVDTSSTTSASTTTTPTSSLALASSTSSIAKEDGKKMKDKQG